MAVAAVIELGNQIKDAQGFRARSFKVHADTKSGHRILDRSLGKVFIPLSDIAELTAAARVPAFLDGTPRNNPGKDPLSRTHGYKIKDVYIAPSNSQDPSIGFSRRSNTIDRRAQRESIIQQTLTNLENITMSAIHRDEWQVPASSQSTDWTRATIFDRQGGTWLVDRQAYTEPRGNYRSSSIVIGSRLSLIHTDINGDVRTFNADVPFPGNNTAVGSVIYSEVKDGKGITFYNGSHGQKSVELASEFAQLGPDNVLLVKNEITKPLYQNVWENPSASPDVINHLLTEGRVHTQEKLHGMEIFDLSQVRSGQAPREVNGQPMASVSARTESVTEH